MIRDLNDIDNDVLIESDICIIGAGAIGIATALEFIQSGYNIALLEGGGEFFEEESQKLYDCDVVGLKHNVHESRARVLGGTTTLWAGQAAPLEKIDFEGRDWVNESGWPFGREELEPFYPRVEEVMNVHHTSYDARSWESLSEKKAYSFNASKLQMVFSQFSPKPNFSQAYKKTLKKASNVDIWLHANATEIVPRENGSSVKHVEIRSLHGKRGKVKASYYVVCCGSIESARLLLASNSINKTGLGNEHDLVGRYFQDHVHMLAAPIIPTHRKTFIEKLGARYEGSVRICPKIAASRDFQREHKILNIAGDLCFEESWDSAVGSAKLVFHSLQRRELRSQIPQALLNVCKNPHEVVEAMWKHFVLKRPVSQNKGNMYFGIQCESEPNPESRVTLSSEKDALGMNRAQLNWKLTGKEKQTIEKFVRAVDEEFKRLGVGYIDLSEFDLPKDPSDFDKKVHDAAHHMGTTRMHKNPRKGVVDVDCKVHGLSNLYIGSCSVLPTVGFSNPTFNALALSLRLADRLRKQLG